jgi:hypothetical protein
MMTGRVFDREKDLETMSSWGEAIHGWVPPKEALTPLGVMIVEDEVNCACGFLYMDVFTPVSSINWLLVNPDLSPWKKDEAVHAVFAYLSKISIDENRPVVMFYGKDGIARVARSHGFIIADKEIMLMCKPVSKENFHA